MKKAFVIIAAAATSMIPGAWTHGENTVAADSRITEVIVYEDRAQVTRAAKAGLQAGENEVVFKHLPASVMEDSIRASGKGTVPVKITGLEIERVYLRDAAEEKVRGLKERIQKLRDRDTELSYNLAALKEQREFVTSIRMGTTDRISKELLAAKPHPEEWEKVSAFIRRGMDENSGERMKVEAARRENKKEIDALERELAQLSAGAKEEKTVTVSLDAGQDGAFTVDLSYTCSGARWIPIYDARADKKNEDVEITYKGAVIQATGEDWSDVALSLSTARPSAGGRPGELYPWYISIHPPYEMKQTLEREFALREAAAPPMLMEGAIDKEAIGADELMEAAVSTATAEKRGQAVLFKIAKRESVPSDGNPHMTTIAIEKLKAGFSYTAVPRLNELAFLKARVTNDTSYPFLAGKINVFLGPDFIGPSFM